MELHVQAGGTKTQKAIQTDLGNLDIELVSSSADYTWQNGACNIIDLTIIGGPKPIIRYPKVPLCMLGVVETGGLISRNGNFNLVSTNLSIGDECFELTGNEKYNVEVTSDNNINPHPIDGMKLFGSQGLMAGDAYRYCDFEKVLESQRSYDVDLIGCSAVGILYLDNIDKFQFTSVGGNAIQLEKDELRQEFLDRNSGNFKNLATSTRIITKSNLNWVVVPVSKYVEMTLDTTDNGPVEIYKFYYGVGQTT